MQFIEAKKAQFEKKSSTIPALASFFKPTPKMGAKPILIDLKSQH